MAFTTPVFVPLVKGMDQSKAPQLGPAELVAAVNADYTLDGEVRGRPSRSAADQFVVRDPATSTLTAPAYLTAQTLAASGYTPLGLVKVRDGAGERAALGTAGRLFEHVDDQWVDRGHFACMRSDRLSVFRSGITNPVDSRGVVTTDFGYRRNLTGLNQPVWSLLSDTGGYDREQAGTAGDFGYAGNGARCGTVTAIVSRGNDEDLHIHLRSAGGAVTRAVIASDCAAPDDTGDAPAICCDHDAGVFYVAYIVTGGTTVKVLRVTTAGTVTHTYTSGVISAVNGIWVANTTVAGDRVVLATTDTDGLTLRYLDQTDLSATGTSDTYATSAGTDGSDVVVGCQDATRVWWCYRSEESTDGDLALGVATVDLTPMTLVRRFYGGNSTAANSYITWAICHQPIKFGGRMYLTLAATTGGQTTATWITLDLTNFYNSTAGTGPFPNPTLAAMGPAQVTYPHLQPSAAVTLADGTGFGFATTDWTSFQLQEAAVGWVAPDTAGFDARTVWNTVKLSGPKATHAGSATVISGSVPHFVAGGECTELGFPFCAGIPGVTAADDGASGGVEHDYGIQACWRWTDAAGQIHRSAPSAIVTQTAGGGFGQDLLVIVTNPWLSEKANEVYIEVYITDADPTEDAPHFLHVTELADFSAAYTTVSIAAADFPVTGTEPIYSDGGVLPNRQVRADGGVITVGRRLWMADANTVYASKYLTPGEAPNFNDFGTHQVNVPAGAGRIVALEKLDDKVVVFCERGVFAIQDGGPDKTGVGADFMPALQLSDLNIAGPRSSCSTDVGVVFCTTLDEVDAARGGPWLLDRQLTFTERQYLGRAANQFFLRKGDWVPQVAYSSARQQVYISVGDGTSIGHGVVVLDTRVGKWSSWELTGLGSFGGLRSIAVANGVLWALNTEPAPYDGEPGAGDEASYPLIVRTAHLAADGQFPLGWGRIRGLRVLHGDDDTQSTYDHMPAYTLDIDIVQDGTRASTSGAISVAESDADVSPTLWPASRQAIEWRLPYQKCSTIQVTLTAQPAVARWVGFQLDVTPLRGPAPAKNRS